MTDALIVCSGCGIQLLVGSRVNVPAAVLILTRKRHLGDIQVQDKTFPMHEYANVCSRTCVVKVAAAWPHNDSLRDAVWDRATFFVGDEECGFMWGRRLPVRGPTMRVRKKGWRYRRPAQVFAQIVKIRLPDGHPMTREDWNAPDDL